MTSWVAIAYGVLDIRGWQGNTGSIELLLVGVAPAEPLGLGTEAALLWRRLALAGPVQDDDMSVEQQSLVREFADTGLASSDENHSARITEIDSPWFSSPLHEVQCSMLASIARDNSIDVLIIKGPTLKLQNLREREHSGDIDIWVDPNEIVRFSHLLENWGWDLFPNFWGDIPAYHAMTLSPRAWGCEIDLHRHMPGCAAKDRDAFRTASTSSTELTFAGVAARVPSPKMNAVLSALHHTRPHPFPNPPSTVALAVDVLRRVGPEVITTSDDVRATAALEPVLRAAFPEATISPNSKLPLNWRWRAEASPFRRAALSLRSVPLKSWPRFLGRLIWPAPDIAMRFDRTHGGISKTALGARLRRLRFAVNASILERGRSQPQSRP